MNFNEFRALQKECSIDSLKVSYVDYGQGPALLLIHGIPVWGYLFKDMIEDLSKDYRLIIPDLLGYGYSDQRDCFDRSIKVQSKMIEKLLDKLAVKELYVFGHDIGGAVAQRLSIDNEQRVLKLMLADSVFYDSWPAEPMVKLSNPSLHYRVQNDELAKKFEKRLPLGFSTKERANAELFEGWMKPYAHEEGKLSLIRNASALNTNHTMEMIEPLKKINKKMPFHLIWGEDDEFQPLKSAKRFKSEFQNSTLEVIKGSNHFLPLEKPQIVIKALKSFCS